MRRLLIDGDQFLFKAAAAVEREVRWDEQNHVLYSNEHEAMANFTGMMDRIFERFETQEHALCVSSYPVWRTKLSAEYKAGRSRKPLCYSLLLEAASKKYAVEQVPGLEADDVMGLIATSHPQKTALNYIVVSQDKDMKTVPCTVWDGESLITYTEAEADYWHMFQTLTGDKVDGYKGCPGCGPVKTKQILDLTRSDARWGRIVATYEKAGLTEADALLNARLARILRMSDWDVKKQEPILWTP
jgi:DNA polymerase I